MKLAPIPENEAERLAALRRYGILDTPAEDEFDDFTHLAAQICGTPIALVSLVDAERQWFKSRVGLEAAETPRDISFCGHAIHGGELLEVPDAVEDERFRDNPLVTGPPGIRFYAGAPLTTPSGFNAGTLCVIDRVPRRLSPEQREALTRLSRQVVARMELRLANLRLAQQAAFQSAILANAASAIIAVTPEGIITHFNPEAERILGYTAAETIGLRTPEMFHDAVEVAARAAELSQELGREIVPGPAVFVTKPTAGEPETREWTYIRKDGSRLPVLLSLSAMYGPTGELDGFLAIARDITQQKATSRALQHERQRLELALSSANLAMWDADATSGRVFLDERWAAMIGEGREPTVSTVDELLQRVPDEYRPMLRSTVVDAMKGCIARYEIEHPVRTTAGTSWILSHGQVIERDSQGRALRIIGINADITRRKEAELLLRESEAFLRDLFDNSGDLIQSVAPDGRVVFVNLAWREVLGYSESEIRALNVFDVIAPDCREHCREIFQRLMDGEQVPMVELVFLSKGGRRIEVEGNVTVRSEKGQPSITRGIFRDVTVRNENDRQRRAGVEQSMTFQSALLVLRDHERDELSTFYRVATSGIAQALNVERVSVWLFNSPLPSSSLTRTRTTPAGMAIECQDLFRLSTLSHESGLRLGAGEYPCYFEAISSSNAVVANEAHTDPATVELTNGYLDPFGITSLLDVPIQGGQQMVGVLCCEHVGSPRSWTSPEIRFAINAASYIMLALEHEERRKAEAALRESAADLKRTVKELADARDAADAASRAKTAFLANMSHEIRTPLNTIAGMLELFEHAADRGDRSQMLWMVRESTKALTGIIDDVLDLSKIEAGMLDIHPEAVSLRDAIGAACNVFSASASAKGLYLHQIMDERLPAAVYCDPVRLRQILYNLLGNAIKFTDAGGIEVRSFLHENLPTAVVIRIEVADTGIGIGPDAQARLFQPFVQAEAGTTRKFGGTGLGLAISRRLADLLGGTLTLESEVGRGTTMILLLTVALADPGDLPATATATTTTTTTTTATATVKNSKLLLVDDSAMNRNVLSRQLAILGCDADQAGDGREALEMWRSGEYALLITDCHMPEMDGYDLARNIRQIEAADPARHRTPIVAYTANALQDSRDLCLEAGMDDVLVKPVGLQAIRAKLDTWLTEQGKQAGTSGQRKATEDLATDGPIDWTGLDEVTGGDPSFAQDMLRDFLADKVEEAQRLMALLATEDMREIERLAHRMKGAAKAICARSLAAVCQEIESAAASGSLGRIIAARQDLEEEFARVSSYIEQRDLGNGT